MPGGVCRAILCMMLVVLPCVAARAQTAVDGAIAGRVVSAEGGEIAGAELALTGEQGLARVARSGRHGEFRVIGLPPGEYRLAARAAGYRGQITLTVEVELGRTTEVQVGRPVVGPMSRREERRSFGNNGIRLVDLNGRPFVEEPVLVREGMSPVIGDGELHGLPVEGRDWGALALEEPAAHADPEADGADLTTVRGLQPELNASQIDGVSHDQGFGAVPVGTGASAGQDEDSTVLAGGASGAGYGRGRHAGAVYTYSLETVREFRLSERSYTALYGQSAGAMTTAVTRGGSDVLHGAAFLTGRESGWSAANPFSVSTAYQDGVVTSGVVKPRDVRAQYGGRVGGPLWRGRLFYLASYDALRRSFPAVSSPAYAGFYTLTATQTALLRTRGVSTGQIGAALNYLSGLTGPVERRHDQTILFGRLDWRAGALGRVSVSYNRARWASPAGATTAAVVARGRASLGNNDGDVDEAVLRWSVSLGGRWSNELRLLYGHDLEYQTAQAPLPQEPAVGPGGLAPQVSIGPEGMLFGTPASLGRKAYPDERRLEVAEGLSWMKGRHLLRVGGAVSWVHDRVDALTNQEGSFSYDSGTTSGHAGGLVDWITDYTFSVHAYPNGGCPAVYAAVHYFCFHSFSQSFGEQTTSFGMQEWSGYVQDDWRVRAGLTVNLGVRYEYTLLPLPQQPNVALDAVFGKVGATSVFPEDRNNYGPRVGVAWSPRWLGGGVLRVGYGLYFGRLPGVTVRSALVNTAQVSATTRVRITPSTETVCPQVPNQGFGYPCAFVAQPVGVSAVAATGSAMVFDRRFRLPEVQQATVALEHGVGGGVMATASFTMNLDRELMGSVDLNVAPATKMGVFQIAGGSGVPGVQDGEQFVLPVYTARVNAGWGPVTDIVSRGNGSYSGLLLEARRRVRGLEVRVGWTWSKAMDYGQTGGGVPRTNGQLDPFTNAYDKGLSGLNYPHRVTASAVWSPEVHGESRLRRAMLNGWSASPMVYVSSGRPYSYEIYGGTELSGGRESINGSGGLTYLPTVGRNTLRLPEQWHANLRVSKRVSVGERVSVRAVAECFNVTNHVNYSGVTQRAFLAGDAVNGVTPLVFQDAATVTAEGLNVRPFGTFTAAGSSDAQERQVQMGVRVEF